MVGRADRPSDRFPVPTPDGGERNPSAGRLAPEPILDEGPFDSRPPDEDWWRAASPFRAAYMVRGKAAAPSRCLFSGLMIEALTGAHADAFDPERNCVTNFKLDEFLKREVPRLAATPAARPTIRLDRWLPVSSRLAARRKVGHL